jgi:hypothetical protein
MDIQAFVISNTYGKPRNIPMTFDTGAYMTTIDTAALSRAGYNVKSGNITYIDTVGRKGIPAREVLLRGLELGDIDSPRLALGPVLVYAVDMSDTPETVGVLGLNVIREFITKITFGNPTTIELIPTFDVNALELYENFTSGISRFGLWEKSHINET